MELLKFSNKNNFAEISLVDDESDTQAKSDAYITIKVSSNGYSGENDLWVSGDIFKSFCSNLVTLERDRKGEAVLESVSPDELEVKIFSIDCKGHMAISGRTGYMIIDEDAYFDHSVTFGFCFYPSQLISACKVSWIKKHTT